MIIDTKQHLEQAALTYGLLPFFSNPIVGFSVEEMAAPGKLFGEDDGCWEWKGPVIREMTTAYGKFFRGKAGFVSVDLYPDFINYRRQAYPIAPDSIESGLLDVINATEGATVAELRDAVFGKPKSRRRADDLVESLDYVKPRRQALAGPLQRLQMGGRLLTADFQYKMTRAGQPYGWGVAIYTTPEIWFGREIADCPRTPEQSFALLVDHLARHLPHTPRPQIASLLH